MTLAMPDSTDVAALPPGYGQYLGYWDGNRIPATMPALKARFPHARLIGLTVTGGTLDADGADSETEDLTAKGAAQWARQKLNRQPASRPVIYASVVGQPGYGMPWVLDALAVNGIAREQVRLLSAHYGAGEHICGPHTCGEIGISMDGTQWTDGFAPNVDMSVLRDGFFGSWTEELMRELPVVQQGDTGEMVKTVQGCLLARNWNIGNSGPMKDGLDGNYGPKTKNAVWNAQQKAGFTGSELDGVVGPLTWPVLLGIA